MLLDPAIKLVFITAANAAHKPLTLKALAAGKAVMCEKPMATTLEDAWSMVEAAERYKGFLQIGFELQKASWRNKKDICGFMFGEKLSHYVDLPRWWIGSEVSEVYSVCSPNITPYSEVRDNYHTTYRFSNGAVSHLTYISGPAATFKGDPLQNVLSQQLGDGHALRYLIVGTKGAIETDVFARTVKRWEFKDLPEGSTSTLVESLTWSPEEDHSYFHNTCEQTHDIVRRVAQGLPPKTLPRDSYETMRLCFLAEESADSGKVISLK
nr:Gfo/Idh/MocA family oxidoreductase [Paenibacillus agaridevorans]